MKSGWEENQRGLANKLLHVRRGSTERYQGQRLSMLYGSTTRVRGLSGGPIEDDLVSGLKGRDWLVRNWLSSPAHPAHPAHPVWGESDGLWLLSQSAKPWTLQKFRRSPVRKTLLRTGIPFIHHTSYRPKVAGGESVRV
jgi:hypothetical protein